VPRSGQARSDFVSRAMLVDSPGGARGCLDQREQTRQRLREAEAFEREQVRVHYRLLESFRKTARVDAADRGL
jgi:hypothetical protein